MLRSWLDTPGVVATQIWNSAISGGGQWLLNSQYYSSQYIYSIINFEYASLQSRTSQLLRTEEHLRKYMYTWEPLFGVHLRQSRKDLEVQ